MKILKARPDREVAVLECPAWVYEGAKGVACGAVVEFERGDVIENKKGSDFVRCPCCGGKTGIYHLVWKKGT